jgi:hypothetical protein
MSFWLMIAVIVITAWLAVTMTWAGVVGLMIDIFAIVALRWIALKGM